MEEVLDDVYRIEIPRTEQRTWQIQATEAVACHVAVGEQNILFGTGHGAYADVLIDALEEVGGLDVIIVEHGDSDHYGGLPTIVDHFGDVTIAMPDDDAPALPKVFYGVSADIRLGHDEVHWGLRTIHVPGHTAGNMSFLDEERDILYVGDTVVNSDSEIAAPGDWSGAFAPIDPGYNADDEMARENVVILADYDFDAALITHGSDVTSGARAELDKLMDDLGL